MLFRSGVERMSAKLRKKINDRLESGKGYLKTIWINFGRTVEEGSLKAFSDFAEQILDGMLDDNFGNTGAGDFVPLPYVNLVVTANTPPNLNQLTSDRFIFNSGICKNITKNIKIISKQFRILFHSHSRIV